VDDLKKLYEESKKLKTMQVQFLPDKALFSEGERSLDMYILLSGKVEVLKNNKRIAVVEEEGSYLGELSTLMGIPRTATVKTMTPCRFIVVGGDRAMDFFSSSPLLGLKLARMLADRLVKMNNEHVRLKQRIDFLSIAKEQAEGKLDKRDQQITRLMERIDRIEKL
jgi:CRP-like cAMP-binding protein